MDTAIAFVVVIFGWAIIKYSGGTVVAQSTAEQGLPKKEPMKEGLSIPVIKGAFLYVKKTIIDLLIKSLIGTILLLTAWIIFTI